MNFEVVSGLVTPGEPDRSLLLLEPLARSEGGSAFHVGGKFWDSRDHADWQAISAWVRTGDVGSAPAREVMLPDFQFFRTCIQQIVEAQARRAPPASSPSWSWSSPPRSESKRRGHSR